MKSRSHVFLMLLVLFSLPCSRPGAEENPETVSFRGETEVLASRIIRDPVASGRREISISREEILDLPVHSIQDVLAIIPGIALARRGAPGVQGDLNIRGSSFEQAVVMVNGIRVNNPQSGHHHLDLFVPLEAIDHIEVLFGPGSAGYGPDAFGGAVNIVTGPPPLQAKVGLGQHHLSAAAAAWSSEEGWWLAAERMVHTGFEENTELDLNRAAAGYSWLDQRGSGSLMVSAGRKKFGANSFYSTRFPDEREATSGRLLTLGGQFSFESGLLRYAFRADEHHDDFILDRFNPGWYHNRHRTRGLQGDFSYSSRHRSWSWLVGVEGAFDEIRSNSLGDHDRSRFGVFGEIGKKLCAWHLGMQLRGDYQEPWGFHQRLAGGASRDVGNGTRLRFQAATSFRAPSFTDLYYESPSTLGDPRLRPEKGRSFEVGLEHRLLSLSLFQRRADPIIDYVLQDDGVWRASNEGSLETRGLEAALFLPRTGRFAAQRLSASYLDSRVSVDPTLSRYALAHPKLEAAWTGKLRLPGKFRSGWALRWRKPQEGGSWWTLDLRLERSLGAQFRLALEASNCFDRKIRELHGVPLPGRWITMWLRWKP